MSLACDIVRQICLEAVAPAMGDSHTGTFNDGGAYALASALFNTSPARKLPGSDSDKMLAHAAYLEKALSNVP